jgi:carboxyl-terminal processing protease
MSQGRFAMLALFCAAAVACGAASDAVAPPSSSAMSASARGYLTSALDIMQSYSYYRSKIDWPALRGAAFASAESAQAQTPAGTYPAIRAALAALGDHHSFLQPPVSASLTPSLALSLHPADSLDGEIVGDKYGYIRVPTYAPVNGGSTTQAAAFADTLQALVRSTDAKSPCGWVIDLRHNLGGNMWPMLAGIGPIVGESDNLGAFVDASGAITRWYYTAGASGTTNGLTKQISATVDRAPYVLRTAGPPVAVLTDGRTASSGEAITVSFRGRPTTRSFGAATTGVPTANSAHPLSDGAVIWLMVALDMDRTGRQYVDPIVPDEPIATTAAPATDDNVVAAALAWLGSQSACKA